MTAEPRNSSRRRSVELRLLGRFEVLVDGRPLPELPSRRARARIAYLGMAGGKPVPRSHLAELLWPDAEASKARQRLRQLLTDLRHVPSAACQELVGSSRIELWLARTIEVDAFTFDDAAEVCSHVADASGCDTCRERLEIVCQLYRGPFLGELDLAGTDLDDWAEQRRRDFEQRALDSRLRAPEIASDATASEPALLDSLVARGFVRPSHTRAGRLYVPALLRGFLREKLAERRELVPAYRAVARAYLGRLYELCPDDPGQEELAEFSGFVDREEENLLDILDASQKHGALEAAAYSLIERMRTRFWRTERYQIPARYLAHLTRDGSSLSREQLLAALILQSETLSMLRTGSAGEAATRLLELARADGHTLGECTALDHLARTDWDHGHHARAVERFRKCQELSAQRIPHEKTHYVTILDLALTTTALGRRAEARAWSELALRWVEDHHRTNSLSGALCAVGIAELCRGETSAARAHLRRAKLKAAEFGYERNVRMASVALVELHLQRNELDRADEVLADLLSRAPRAQPTSLGVPLFLGARRAAFVGDPAAAARLLGATQPYWETYRTPVPWVLGRYEALRASLRQSLGRERLEDLLEEGQQSGMAVLAESLERELRIR